MSERLEKSTAQGLRTNESDFDAGLEHDHHGISQPAVPIQYKASSGQELQQEKEQHSGTAEEKYVLASAVASSSGGDDDSKSEGNPIQGKFQSGFGGKQQVTQYKYQIASSYPAVSIQRMAEEEEPLQGKMNGTMQRMAEEEEPLQGKMSGTIQRMAEEEEPLQGKMQGTIQRMAEEEEPLQGKMQGTMQRMAEQEEPIQGKMIRPIQKKSSRTRTMQRQSATSAQLPTLVQSKMEGAMGADFSGVNIHTESQQASNVGALAFAQGNDVHFAPGQYDPQSTSGQELIGHELAHVVQQREGRVQPTTQAKGVPVNDDKGLEAEADSMGQKAAQFQADTTVTKPKSPNFSSIQPMQLSSSTGVLQLALNATQKQRLIDKLGNPKYKKIAALNLEETFNKYPDERLESYKLMAHSDFDDVLQVIKSQKPEGILGSLGEKGGALGGTADLLGSALETGEEASEILGGLPKLMGNAVGSASGVVGATADGALEGIGGGIGGLKDTYEGGSSLYNQKKIVEGGTSLVSGLSGLLSLLPGVPDAVGLIGSGAKVMGGVTKAVNTRTNRAAIEKLKTSGHPGPKMIKALDILADSTSYLDGTKQAVLGGMEGVGSAMGGVAKYGTSLLSKGVDSLPGMAEYAFRALGSYTSYVDSNATKGEQDKQEKTEQQGSMYGAVMESKGNPQLIGKFRHLANLIDPEFASVIDNAIDQLTPPRVKNAAKKAVKDNDTFSL